MQLTPIQHGRGILDALILRSTIDRLLANQKTDPTSCVKRCPDNAHDYSERAGDPHVRGAVVPTGAPVEREPGGPGRGGP